MGSRSSIAWTEASWTPIRYGRGHVCMKISPGCENCYASRFQGRLGNPGYLDETSASKAALRAAIEEGMVRLDEKALHEPEHWKRPRMIFLSSMTDLFLDEWPESWLDRIFHIIATTPQHTYQILSKRPHRMRDYLQGLEIAAAVDVSDLFTRDMTGALRLPTICAKADGTLAPWPLPNVWLGVSVESDAFTWRAKVLAECPAIIRWVSAEPLLGPITSLPLDKLDWVVAGGESGGPPERRLVEPCHQHYPRLEECWFCSGTSWMLKPQARAWARVLRNRCKALNVPFFWKQGGGPTNKSSGHLLDGMEERAWPAVVSAS